MEDIMLISGADRNIKFGEIPDSDPVQVFEMFPSSLGEVERI